MINPFTLASIAANHKNFRAQSVLEEGAGVFRLFLGVHVGSGVQIAMDPVKTRQGTLQCSTHGT